MARPPRLDLALKRLYGALDDLEAGARRRVETRPSLGEAASGAATGDAEHVGSEDLKHERDAAMLRAQMLEQAATEVAGRLDRAGSSLRRLLEPRGEG